MSICRVSNIHVLFPCSYLIWFSRERTHTDLSKETEALNISPALVVLRDSARGQVKAEGVIGFLSAGSHSVLVSLWRVAIAT